MNLHLNVLNAKRIALMFLLQCAYYMLRPIRDAAFTALDAGAQRAHKPALREPHRYFNMPYAIGIH